jgi:hypothetical protein
MAAGARMTGAHGPGATTRRRVDPALLVLAVAPLVAVALGLVALHAAGLTGVDSAAHAYKTGLVAHGQGLVWDDLWYAGSYGVLSYGAGYYLLAALVGGAAVVVASAGLLPLLFHLYARRAWGVTSLWPAIALAAVLVVYLANGQDPFLLAMALTMAGLALLAGDHPFWAALPVGLAALTNPVAVVVGGVFVVAEAIARPAARRRLPPFVLALLPFAVLWLGLQLAFRAHVSYLDQPVELLKWTAVAAVGVVLARLSADPDRRAKEILFAVAGVLCLAAIVVPTELGNNAARFLMLFGLPALLMVRRIRLPRPATPPRPGAPSSHRRSRSRWPAATPTTAATWSPCVCTGRPATFHRPAWRSPAAGFARTTGSTTPSCTARRRRRSTSPGCATWVCATSSCRAPRSMRAARPNRA